MAQPIGTDEINRCIFYVSEQGSIESLDQIEGGSGAEVFIHCRHVPAESLQGRKVAFKGRHTPGDQLRHRHVAQPMLLSHFEQARAHRKNARFPQTPQKFEFGPGDGQGSRLSVEGDWDDGNSMTIGGTLPAGRQKNAASARLFYGPSASHIFLCGRSAVPAVQY